MQFRIVRGVRVDQVSAHIHRALRPVVPPISSEGKLCTLLLFRFQRDEKSSGVVRSATVERALSQLGDGKEELVLAFGGDFTVEAKSLLVARGARIVAISDHGWTDERHKEISELY
jgi:hypothetical protein